MCSREELLIVLANCIECASRKIAAATYLQLRGSPSIFLTLFAYSHAHQGAVSVQEL